MKESEKERGRDGENDVGWKEGENDKGMKGGREGERGQERERERENMDTSYC